MYNELKRFYFIFHRWNSTTKGYINGNAATKCFTRKKKKLKKYILYVDGNEQVPFLGYTHMFRYGVSCTWRKHQYFQQPSFDSPTFMFRNQIAVVASERNTFSFPVFSASEIFSSRNRGMVDRQYRKILCSCSHEI